MIVSQYIDYCRLAEYQYCHWHTVNGFISWVILRFPPLFWIISLKKKKTAIWMLSSKADQHDWFVVLILKSQCCLTIVDKVKQHEPRPSHDDSHCDTLSWLVTLVTSHASLCFDATLNNSQSFNKLQRVSAKPTVSLDRDTVPEHADMFLLSCIIRAQGAWTIYRLPPPPSPSYPWRQLIVHLMWLYLIALCNGIIGLSACYPAGGEFWDDSDDSLQ